MRGAEELDRMWPPRPFPETSIPVAMYASRKLTSQNLPHRYISAVGEDVGIRYQPRHCLKLKSKPTYESPLAHETNTGTPV